MICGIHVRPNIKDPCPLLISDTAESQYSSSTAKAGNRSIDADQSTRGLGALGDEGEQCKSGEKKKTLIKSKRVNNKKTKIKKKAKTPNCTASLRDFA